MTLDNDLQEKVCGTNVHSAHKKIWLQLSDQASDAAPPLEMDRLRLQAGFVSAIRLRGPKKPANRGLRGCPLE
jgi:hypothetical protein